jgi:phosphoglycerol transferase MdoB-like AlkP superfamily enzyme
VHIHTTATWPAREDRRAALVWLAIFWIFVGVGFGFDLHNYLHEQPAVPKIVHVHAIVTALWLLTATALVLMVETDNVRLHRLFGWYAAGYAALILVIAPWSELSWQARNLQTPGTLPPQFLSIAFSAVFCMAVLLACGILLRRNSAAHRRVLILAIICISDAGFSRMVNLFLPAPTTFLGTYLFYEGGTLLLIVLMFLWDWKRNRIMKQFLWAASFVIAVGLAATGLFFNETWQSISRSWLEGWARNML